MLTAREGFVDEMVRARRRGGDEVVVTMDTAAVRLLTVGGGLGLEMEADLLTATSFISFLSLSFGELCGDLDVLMEIEDTLEF